MRSSGNGGVERGLMAILMSFMGLSSAATRFEPERAAGLAAMDYRPLSFSAHPYGNRLHNSAAVRFAVAGFDIDMQA